jgi:uncharacterized protein
VILGLLIAELSSCFRSAVFRADLDFVASPAYNNLMDMITFEEICLAYARKKCSKRDYSHDFLHASRVLTLVKKLQKTEGGNLKVLIPSALFHDIVIYPKNSPMSKQAQEKSALAATMFLRKHCPNFLSEVEIAHVHKVILECSFSKNIPKTCIEGKIVQDADGLEAIGSIGIMRAFDSGATMQRQFYNEVDPFCVERKPEPKMYSLDLFFVRILKIKERLSTKSAKTIAQAKESVVHQFLNALRNEL